MTIQELEPLRLAIEQKIGKKLINHADFIELQQLLNFKLGATTLKRIWGYIKDLNTPSLRTANVLSEFLGFKDFSEFKHYNNSSCLDHHEFEQVYQASELIKLAGLINEEKYQSAFKMLEDCKYQDAVEYLSEIELEIERLLDKSEAIVDSSNSFVALMAIKAISIWSKDYSNEDIIIDVDKIFEKTLPLAHALNNHYLLWLIYHNWANFSKSAGQIEAAIALHEKAIIQGKILLLENENTAPVELLSSLCNKAHILSDQEEYESSEQLIDYALGILHSDNYPPNLLIKGYLLLNKGSVLMSQEKEFDFVQNYHNILEDLDTWHQSQKECNESVHLQTLCYYNLGRMYDDLIEGNHNPKLAIEYYKKVIELYEHRDIPSDIHDFIFHDAHERISFFQNPATEVISK